ncbi:hypothetical protein KY360_06535 [Candidatus Woesearchaeota archaeon]|nr:hypothetical protein [Candidatus Woesearchaeota archaeon]
MIDNRLVGYIRTYMGKGYNKSAIADYLVKLGYPSQNVWDTINSMAQAKPMPQKQILPVQPIKKAAHKKYAPGAIHAAGFSGKLGLEIALVVIPLILLAGGYFMFLQPVCGNGKIERGETMETCCDDTSCLGEQLCEEHSCIEPTCDECQFLDDHVCVDYECCDSKDCADDKRCTDHKCESIVCEECQYIENRICLSYECCKNEDCSDEERCMDNHCVPLECGECEYLFHYACLPYVCCSHEDCDDDDPATIDTCDRPGTINATCSHEEILDECTINTECDDNVTSTRDICTGTPKTCSNIPITACLDGDNYCPSGCTYDDDNDCAQPDECLTDDDCDDDDPSTIDNCTGTPKTCSNTLTTECITGDDYCPSGCIYDDDQDCAQPDECSVDVDCDDSDPSTADNCSGTPKTCFNTPITECIDGDDYCPSTCTPLTDNNCRCSADAECYDSDPSTTDACAGAPPSCSNILITGCVGGDNYCPLGCDDTNDTDCQASIDCDLDIDCFITASENCERASVTNTSVVNLFGMLQETTNYLEIKGIELNKCVFYHRIVEMNVTFTEVFIQNMLDQGSTQEEIDQSLQQANDDADSLEGLDGTCRFDQADLTAMLNRWKEGNYASSDYNVAECEGDLHS